MPLAQDDDVIQTLSSNRSNEFLRISILPRRPWRCPNLFDVHRSHLFFEGVAKDAIVVSDEISWCRLPGTGFHNLTGSPLRHWVCGNGKVDELPSCMADHNEDIKQPKANSWNNQEVYGGNPVCMVAEKRPPGLRWSTNAQDFSLAIKPRFSLHHPRMWFVVVTG